MGRIAEELPRDIEGRILRMCQLINQMLTTREASERPFIIISDMETERFIQFAGSKTEQLLLDVPALNYSQRKDMCPALMVVAYDMLDQQLHKKDGRWLIDFQWTDLN